MSDNTQPKRFVKITPRKLGVTALVAATVLGVSLTQLNASAQQQTTPTPTDQAVTGQYIDGEYDGDTYTADHWGQLQVRAIIENGELSNIEILNYPHSTGRSLRISQIVIPYLMQEAVQAQNADIDMISGATPTSYAFIHSLQSALDQASNPDAVQVTPTSTGTSI